MRLAIKVSALYISAVLIIWALFLSFGAAQGSGGSPHATIHSMLTAPPVPYAHLDFSRAVNPQYDIMMSQMETMTPRKAAQGLDILSGTQHHYEAKFNEQKPDRVNEAGKLVFTTIMALMASFGVLWYAFKKKLH